MDLGHLESPHPSAPSGGRDLPGKVTERERRDLEGRQGHTADRVLVDVDTATLGAQLVNRRLAYVAVSRGRYDAQIYTNDVSELPEALSRDIAHRSAIEPGPPTAFRPHHTMNEQAPSQRLGVGPAR
jgi:hypothetical protein